MKNALKLTGITVLTLIISGYLFYEGLKPELINSPISQILPNVATPEASADVLGQSLEKLVGERGKVTKIVDGDTIEVEIKGTKKKLRYIGINTPETVDPRKRVECFGKEASDENKRLLEGKTVILEKDVSETDNFGRLLRFVYLPLDDGGSLFVNDYLIRQGFAFAATYPPDVKNADRFLSAQTEAKENLRGLWNACQSK